MDSVELQDFIESMSNSFNCFPCANKRQLLLTRFLIRRVREMGGGVGSHVADGANLPFASVSRRWSESEQRERVREK